MSTTEVKRIHLTSGVVYIAGYECPVNDISVSFGAGVIPTATLTLPASTELVKFGEEDRVPVAIFYLDNWYTDDGKNVVKPTMRLLFDGEIKGWSIMQTTGGDMITFTCIANVNMMNNMYANFLIGANSAQDTINLDNFSTSTGIVSGSFRTFPVILLNQGLFIGKDQPIERPFDFIANMLLAIKIGGYPNDKAITDAGAYTKDFKAKINANAATPRIGPNAFSSFITGTVPSAVMGFFVMYNHRTKFDKRWIATPLERFISTGNSSGVNDSSVYKQIADPRFAVIREDILNRAQKRALESLFGSGDSFMKLLLTYYSLNAYEIMMLPTAPYVVVGLPATAGGGAGSALSAGIPVNGSFSSTTTEARLGNYISKPVSPFALPPECNIIFPCMANQTQYMESYDTQATRTVTGNPFLDIAALSGVHPSDDKAAKAATTIAWPYDLFRLAVNKTGLEFSSALLYPEEYFKGPVLNNATIPSWYVYLQEGAGDQDKDNTKTRADQNKSAANQKPVAKPVLPNAGSTAEQTTDYATQVNRKLFLTPSARQELYLKYAKYSHYEARFSQRQGSHDLLFNPYLLPCYPFIRFDTGPAQLHMQGQVVQVTHRLSATAGSSTSVGYAYGRTFKETAEIVIASYLDQLANFASSPEGFYNTGPVEPVIEVAQQLQQTSKAAAYYKQTYYQTPNASTQHSVNKSYVFDYATYFSTSAYNGNVMPTSTPVTSTKTYTVTLDLKSQNADNFNDYNEAMKRVSRPICTLEQYISFINGGSSEAFTSVTSGVDGLIPAEVYGVSVPVRIRDYLAGDDSDATEALDHYIVPTATGSIIPTTIYDMRRDWVARIQSYRQKVFGRRIQ
jgi:hypothetical protein